MATLMLDAGYGPGKAGYASNRDRALESALRGVGQETPFLAGLQALPPDALERVSESWARRLRALVLLALRCGAGGLQLGLGLTSGGKQLAAQIETLTPCTCSR